MPEQNKANTKAKKIPKPIQPLPGFELITIKHYADREKITTTGAYKRFQYGTIEVITIDGMQYVKLPK